MDESVAWEDTLAKVIAHVQAGLAMEQTREYFYTARSELTKMLGIQPNDVSVSIDFTTDTVTVGETEQKALPAFLTRESALREHLKHHASDLKNVKALYDALESLYPTYTENVVASTHNFAAREWIVTSNIGSAVEVKYTESHDTHGTVTLFSYTVDQGEVVVDTIYFAPNAKTLRATGGRIRKGGRIPDSDEKAVAAQLALLEEQTQAENLARERGQQLPDPDFPTANQGAMAYPTVYDILYAAVYMGIAVATVEGFKVALRDLSSVSTKRRADELTAGGSAAAAESPEPSFYDVKMNALRHQFPEWETPRIRKYTGDKNKVWLWTRREPAPVENPKYPRYHTWLRL